MTLEAIGVLAEVVGAIGVIASLVYLAIQIRSNTKQLRFEASQTVAESIDRAFDPLYVEPNALILTKGGADLDSLNETERTVYNGLMGRQLHNFYRVVEAQKLDMIDKSATQAMYYKVYADIFGSPGASKWLAENKHMVDAEIHEALNGPRTESGSD